MKGPHHIFKRTILIFAGYVFCGSAFAATVSVIPLNGSGQFVAPSGSLAFDRLRTGESSAVSGRRDVRNNRDNAQSFQLPNATTIDKIAINFSGVADLGKNVTFQFFQVDNAASTTLTPSAGGILDSVTFEAGPGTAGPPEVVGLNLSNGSAGTLVFDVVDTVAAAGTSWAIRFDTTAGGQKPVFKWKYTVTGLGPDPGERYEKNVRATPREYSIGVVGPSVPEPDFLSLFAIAASGLLLRRRRSRKIK